MNDVTDPDGLPLKTLADWKNDDLLLTDEARVNFADKFPMAVRVLDWQALRSSFARYDTLANAYKKEIKSHGVRSVLISTIGATVLAIAPLTPKGQLQTVITSLACLSLAFGMALSIWNFIRHRRRYDWLLARIWTERLRQFHFQYILNNWSSATSAMEDDEKLTAYAEVRNRALKRFEESLDRALTGHGSSAAIRWVIQDDDEYLWCDKAWRIEPTEMPEQSSSLDMELFAALDHQRIEVQNYYALLNLRGSKEAGKTKSQMMTLLADWASVAFALALLSAGGLIVAEEFMTDHATFASWVEALIALSGVCAAWGLYCRMIDLGMGYTLDTDRYELYVRQIDTVRRKFDDAGRDAHRKIDALRLLEGYSYAEMKQFLKVHLTSKFW